VEEEARFLPSVVAKTDADLLKWPVVLVTLVDAGRDPCEYDILESDEDNKCL
jgi:hypothetical protein